MKLLKPVYNQEAKVYTCPIENGARRTVTRDEDGMNPPLNEWPTDEYIAWLIESTKGWFTKPITTEWLTPRLKHSCEITGLPSPFEGTVEYIASRLSITKESFCMHWTINSFQEAPKVVIEFEEEQPEEVEEVEEVPEKEGDILEIGPTRRILHKHKVLTARAKAARALFKAERMTQEYIQLYGEDTDWEDEDSGNESS